MLFFKKTEEQNQIRNRRRLLYPVAVFFILLDIVGASYLIFEKYYSDKVYPYVKAGGIDLGGKEREAAKKILGAKINEINQNGIKFVYEQNEFTLLPIISSFSGDLARELVSFNPDETVLAAYSAGREKNFWSNAAAKIDLWEKGKKVKASFTTDDEEIKKILKESFAAFEQPAFNAELVATTVPNYWKKEILFKIKEERNGYKFDYDKAVEDLKEDLAEFNTSPIELIARRDFPDIKKNECLNIETLAKQFLDNASLTLVFEDKKWPLDAETIASWLMLARGVNNEIVIDLDSEKITKFLEEKVSPAVKIEPRDARFEIKENRVLEFAQSQDGRKVDFPGTISRLRKDFLTDKKTEVEVASEAAKSNIKTEDINDLGIKEIIGTGYSNFAGSPKNRRHNIATGAKALNGLLVAPGEEFSTNNALGDVTAETGYLPEMTIKGNKTVPEYGGGLCQIGTTVFRAALASGLPITARRPHSYRVAYYEPAGTDATIYGPWPDLRFVNDTGHYILIQTKVDGNDLYFDFWGTKDGRVVEKTDPVIYNIVKPGPTKLIETADLKPGEKKCTERAHNGADAYFDYKVTYPDTTVKEERFKSHYVPWQEVCLIGVEKKATSTPAAATPAQN